MDTVSLLIGHCVVFEQKNFCIISHFLTIKLAILMTDTVREVQDVCEKIKFLRQFKKLSQETMAEKLGMSANGYANIERGETDISLTRLYQISKILEVDLPQLLSLDEKGVLYLVGNYNYFTQSQQPQHIQSIHSLLSCPIESHSVKTELEKSQLLLEEKDKQISLLQQQVYDLREMMQLFKFKSDISGI